MRKAGMVVAGMLLGLSAWAKPAMAPPAADVSGDTSRVLFELRLKSGEALEVVALKMSGAKFYAVGSDGRSMAFAADQVALVRFGEGGQGEETGVEEKPLDEKQAAELSALVEKLGDPRYETREEATRRIREIAKGSPRDALSRLPKEHADPEVQARLVEIRCSLGAGRVEGRFTEEISSDPQQRAMVEALLAALKGEPAGKVVGNRIQMRARVLRAAELEAVPVE